MKANSLFLSLILLFIFSCGQDKSCGKIVRKYILNGEYFFAMKAFGGDSESDDILGDAEVSKETYDAFDIGDEYCVD